MNATQPTTTLVDTIDWTYVREFSRRIAQASLFSSPNRAADAEEIAQKVTTELFVNVERGRIVPESVDAVVRNMTRNRVQDWGVSVALWKKVMRVSVEQRQEVGHEFRSRELTPEELAIDREGQERVRRELAHAARTQPRNVRLTLARKFEGTSSQELADRENLTVSSVDAAISKTVAKLRLVLPEATRGRAAPAATKRPNASGRFDSLSRAIHNRLRATVNYLGAFLRSLKFWAVSSTNEDPHELFVWKTRRAPNVIDYDQQEASPDLRSSRMCRCCSTLPSQVLRDSQRTSGGTLEKECAGACRPRLSARQGA